jgi:3-methylfumaryl-CoA hydratase
MTDGELQSWIGRKDVRTDEILSFPTSAFAATLDRSGDISSQRGAELPALWVWLYFLPVAQMKDIGRDGHPRRGGFLPPIALDRRMWAGSRCVFHGTLRIGDTAEKTSTILKIAEKTGKAGSMVFVTVKHEIRTSGQLVYEEEQDIVYVATPDRPVMPEPVPVPPCDWQETVTVDPVLLFRFSALTFNGHRIHYDRDYATGTENYPGLVVHGPLQALLLFEAARQRAPGRRAARFEFRGIRPLFDHDPLTLNGRGRGADAVDLFTATTGGATCMQAAVYWTPEGSGDGRHS